MAAPDHISPPARGARRLAAVTLDGPRRSPGSAAVCRSSALALVAVALGGCSSANTERGVTKQQFVAGATAVCRAERQKLDGVAAEEHVSVAALSDDARLMRHAVAIHERADAKLESLPEPPSEASAIARLLTARTIATTLESDAAQALAKHLATAPDVQRERIRRSAIAQSVARGYGLTACGAIE